MEKLTQRLPANSSFNLQELIEGCIKPFRLNELYKNVSLRLIDDLVSPVFIKGQRRNLSDLLSLLLENGITVTKATKINIHLKLLLKTQDEVLFEFTVEDNGGKNLIETSDPAFAYKTNLKDIIKLVEALKGKIEISTLEGIGTTIKFLLKFFSEGLSDEQDACVHSSLAGKRILVAEDNEINQKIIAHLLRKESLHVDIANDGKEAIELFEKKQYDLLLLDLQMPHMDGFQTAKYIRRIVGSNVPIVAMTAGAFSNEQTRCFEIGINQFLSKPFTADDLFLRLKYLLLNEHTIKRKKKLKAVASSALYNLYPLRLSNDDEQAIEILEMFVSKTPILLAELKEAMELEEASLIIKKTANLKGSLGSLQMQSVIKIVDEIENYVRLEDLHKIPGAVEKLHTEYNMVAPMLVKELGQLQIRE